MYLTAMQFQVNVKASLYARACLCVPHVWRRRYLHTDLAYALCPPSLPPSPLSFPSLSPSLPASLASLDPTLRYTKCYFLLRDVADLMKTPLTLQPLSADEARKLELRMVQYRERIEREYGDISDRINGDGVQGFDLRRVKSDNIYVAKAGSSNAFVM